MAGCGGVKQDDGVWTRERVEALGMVCDVETAGQILGIGRTVAYRLAREGSSRLRFGRSAGSTGCR